MIQLSHINSNICRVPFAFTSFDLMHCYFVNLTRYMMDYINVRPKADV